MRWVVTNNKERSEFLDAISILEHETIPAAVAANSSHGRVAQLRATIRQMQEAITNYDYETAQRS